MFDFHLFQIGMGPVPLDRRSVIDEFGLGCTVAPDPYPICLLDCKFVSPSFRPRLMWHIPSSYLLWPDPIFLLQPFPELEPDIPVELVEGFCRIDRTIVAGPSSNDRIDGLYFLRIIIVGGAPFGHRLDLCF